MKHLSAEYLKELLQYFPETGEWIWLNPPVHNGNLKGKIAGHIRPDGYRIIRINGQKYYAHRLAFLYMEGELPAKEVDHIDRDPSNGRWANLRHATSSQNKFNREPLGIRGVYATGNKWQVMVGRDNYLGLFDNFADAILARDTEAKRLGGDFAILNFS